MWRAPPVLVNSTFFGAKRAYHSILRVTRKPLASHGLTAARFDLLFALFARHESLGERLTQRELRGELGVGGSTVCRMLRSLEALGLVRRERALEDRRHRWVELTDKGLKCIRAARDVLLGAAYRLLERAICRDPDPYEGFLEIAQLERYLDAMRAEYGDTATLSYP
jgi:DNA-binding MarR family transcriptional regulator